MPEKQSLPWHFSLYWIYFLPFRIFEQLCTCPENRVCPEIFHCSECAFYIQDCWATLRLPWETEGALNSLYWICMFYHSGFLSKVPLPWKTELPLNFSLYWMYFLSFRIFEQLALALKKEFALIFFNPGVQPSPPTPRLVRLWCLRLFGWLRESIPPASLGKPVESVAGERSWRSPVTGRRVIAAFLLRKVVRKSTPPQGASKISRA